MAPHIIVQGKYEAPKAFSYLQVQVIEKKETVDRKRSVFLWEPRTMWSRKLCPQNICNNDLWTVDN